VRLPVSPALLLQELVTARGVLEKWEKLVADGVPGVDVPATEDALEEFVTEMCGELLVVSGKCQTLAEVLYGNSR
jgi:hypothetical protein